MHSVDIYHFIFRYDVTVVSMSEIKVTLKPKAPIRKTTETPAHTKLCIIHDVKNTCDKKISSFSETSWEKVKHVQNLRSHSKEEWKRMDQICDNIPQSLDEWWVSQIMLQCLHKYQIFETDNIKRRFWRRL